VAADARQRRPAARPRQALANPIFESRAFSRRSTRTTAGMAPQVSVPMCRVRQSFIVEACF
jgi:hypothetical protein